MLSDLVRITGLTSFEYYGSTGEERSATFTPPDEETLRQMRSGMDGWLALHRGSEQRVTDLEMFELNGEWVFLIRRGDACKRVPMVEGERVMNPAVPPGAGRGGGVFAGAR